MRTNRRAVVISSLTTVASQSQPTAELDRSGDEVYAGVMAMVRQVVQLKNDVSALPASEYPTAVKVRPSPALSSQSAREGFRQLTPPPPSPPLQAVGVSLRSLIESVNEVLPSLHVSLTSEVGVPLSPHHVHTLSAAH